MEGGQEMKTINELQNVLFKDGINYSVQMANLSFSKLKIDLLNVSKNEYSRRKGEKEQLSEDDKYLCLLSALNNAWQVIDSVNRLRELLRLAPGIRKQDMEYKLFFNQTENAEKLRDNIQHLNSQIMKYVENRIPAWGILNWIGKLDETDNLLIFSFVPGSLFERNTSFLNPVGKRITIPIGLITVVADIELCLSELIEVQLLGINSYLKREQNIKTNERAQSMFVAVEFTPNSSALKERNI